MVINPEARIFELVEMYNGRSWRTFKKPNLTLETSLNNDMKIDPEEAYDLLDDIFTEFGLVHGDMNFETYFPAVSENAKPLTIAMLVRSASAGRWLYD